VDVVVILRNKLAELSQQLHDVNTLLKLLGWKMRRYEVHLKLLFGEYTHMLVCLEVMRRQSRHLIEDTTKIMADFFLHTDLLFEKIHIAHVNIFIAIEGP